MEKTKKRVEYFDVLRTIACIAVVIIHISGEYLKYNANTLNFWVGNVFDSIVRLAVPVFVMISGALMLDEEYEFTIKKLKKHIIKMLIFFSVWSCGYAVIYEIINPIMSHDDISAKRIISALLRGHYHLWFVYMIIGLYLILPILRLFIKKCNKKYIEYFLLLSLIFTFLLPQIAAVGMYYNPFFKVLHEVLNTLNLRFVGGYTAYFVLGWYLNNFELKNKSTVYFFGIVGLVITIGGTYIFTLSFNENSIFYNNLYVNVLAQAVALFVLVKSAVKPHAKEKKISKFIAKHSLGIYAIHAFLVSVLYKVFEKIGISNALIVIPVSFVAVFGISLFASFIMSKIPLLKKIV